MLAYDRGSTSSPTRVALALVYMTALGLVGAVCASCEAGVGPEDLAVTSSDLAISGLFSTGVNAAGAPLANGATDPHYVLGSDDPALPGPNAITVAPAGGWTGNTATSKWISGQASTNGLTGGVYTYTTTFTLSGVNPASATLSGKWACDDSCVMLLNGSMVATNPTPAWGAVASFTVAAGSNFQPGLNTLQIVVTNATGGPTGLQIVSITGSVSAGCSADAQCTAAQFCNTATSTCTAKLANGTAIPTISGHTPTLNGACTTNVGSAVCVSGVCDTKDNACGYGSGDGMCNLINQGTVCRSGTCSSNGACEPKGGCNVDLDCTGGKWCDEATHTCTAKLANGTPIPTDPGHVPTLDGTCSLAAGALVCATGVCDIKDGKCGLADGDAPCTIATAQVCRSGQCSVLLNCRPANGCNADGDCTGGDWCDVSTHTCEAKLPNGSPMPTDGKHTNPTLDGSCSGAAATLVCISGVCDTKDDKCGYASGDGMCTVMNGPIVCRSGSCTGGVCEPSGTCNVDADCMGGQWCNESMHACTPKLMNGAPIPNDPPHTNPTLNGSCTTAAATLVCQSGICSTATGQCSATATSPDGGTANDGGAGNANDAGTSDAGAGNDAGAANDAGGTDGGPGDDGGAVTDGGNDGGASEDGGPVSDAATEDAGADAEAEDAEASAGEDAEASAGEDGGPASSGAAMGGGQDGSADVPGLLEGGGLSCSVSRPGGSSPPCGAALTMCMLALGAAARRAVGGGRRNR